MEFQKYSSLENAYRQKYVDLCLELGIPKWVATEKVHGANFSFIVDGKVTPAKRTSVLDKNEHGAYDFYGCTPVVERYENSVKELAEFIGEPVQIFGELFGQGVQKEINYGEKDFIVFDIQKQDGTFIPWHAVKELCAMFDIPVVPEIAVGTLPELLDLSPDFESIVAGNGDKAEGLVLKPAEEDVRLGSGSRPIIKNKSKAFSEKKEKVAKKPYVMPEHLVAIYQDFSQYITENRLKNVLSKIGTVTQKDFGKLTGEFVKDAKDEFERDEYPISKDDWKGLSKVIGKESSNLIRQNWLNILDGSF